MTPDRTTLTRAEAIRIRKEEEEKRREKRTPQNIARLKPVAAPKPPAPARAQKPAAAPARGIKPAAAPARGFPATTSSNLRRRYDLAMGAAYARGSVYSGPRKEHHAISLPKVHIGFGPRWFSFLIAIFCVVDLYLLLNIDPFIIRSATILGSQRLDAQAIERAVGALNQPAVLVNPAQIRYNLMAAFPEVSSAEVKVNLPADLVITIQERTPVAAWSQDGQIVWIDSQGYAFPPRGEVQNLVSINAAGAPPAPATLDPSQTIGARPFVSADLASEISVLAPSLPQGASLIFDPQYGLGWTDPGGWKVYFGQSSGDTPLKLKVYQAILTTLDAQQVKPAMISVEYPDAPFYRVDPLEQ